MGRPSSISPEQLEEMIKLSATKTVAELAEIYQLDRATIYHHLKQKPKTDKYIFKPRFYFDCLKCGNKLEKPKSHKGYAFCGKCQERKPKKLKREEKINAGKNYVDYLKEENERRKKMGLYIFKQK